MSQTDRYEWDEAKRQENLCKHGVDFTDARQFDWSGALTAKDNRFDYGEDRFNSAGLVGDRLFVMVWTSRGDAVRVISFRKANRREVEYYEESTI